MESGIIAEARKLLDVPFVLYGRDVNVGIDCVAVVALAATNAGFDCPHLVNREVDAYGNRTDLIEAVRKDTMPVRLDDVQPGDMLWFRLDFMPCEMHHFAIVTEATKPIRFLEASLLQINRPGEKKITDLMIMEWPWIGDYARWLRGVFRFRREPDGN